MGKRGNVRSRAKNTVVRTFDPEVSWAAGFFEGEGTITESSGRLVVRLNNTDPEPVYRFAGIVGFGEVYGPYQYAGRDGFRRKPFWVSLAEEYEALEVLELLWPWLSSRRRSRALDFAPIEAILLEASKAAAAD
jgi:hypothetical protein